MKLLLTIALFLTGLIGKAQHPSCVYNFRLFDKAKDSSLTQVKRHDNSYTVSSYTFMPTGLEANAVNRVIGDRGDTSGSIWEIEQLPFRNQIDFWIQIIRNGRDTMNIIAHKDSMFYNKFGNYTDTLLFKKGNFLIFPASNTLSLNDWNNILSHNKIRTIDRPIKEYMRKNYR